MKKLGILALSGALLFSGIATSCASFMGNDPYSIENVASVLNPDGSTTVTIEFTEGADVPDYTFTLPKGTEGNGIENITSKLDENGERIIVTINYTSPDVEDTVIYVPVIEGPGIKSLTEEYDEDGNKILVFTFTDGRPDFKVTIPKGDTGAGIKNITWNTDEATRITNVTISFDDGRDELNFVIPAPLDGVGIKEISIEPDPLTGDNIMIFIMTDDSEMKVSFPRATQWYSGSSDPNLNPALGLTGDYYFETEHLIIYQKSGDTWYEVANLGSATTSTKYKVTFNLNDRTDGGPLASFDVNDKSTYEVFSGRNFFQMGYSVPVPIRTGYTFKGWYTKSEYNVTLGAFTDMVNVFSDMNLYAHWTK